VRKRFHDVIKEKPLAVRRVEMRDFLQSEVDKLGVLSLSEVPDDILMWAHYASSHTGLCLKFEASENTPFFARAQRVDYPDDYQPIKELDINKAIVDRIVLTTSKHWEYEREWRIVDHEFGSGVHKFPPELLAGVIFGCRMKNANKEQVRAWTQGHCNPRFYEAEIIEGAFALGIREVQKGTP